MQFLSALLVVKFHALRYRIYALKLCSNSALLAAAKLFIAKLFDLSNLYKFEELKLPPNLRTRKPP